MLQLKLSEIKQLEALAHQDSSIVSLSQGGLKVDCFFQEMNEYLQKIITTSPINHYGSPMGLRELREELLVYLYKKYQVELSINNIIITHGCSGALSILCTLLLQAGDEVILPTPTYPAYENVIKIANAHPLFAPVFDRKNLLDALNSSYTPKTKMVLLANPSNPTGEVLNAQTIKGLVDWCNERAIYLIMDEVYEDYVFDQPFNSVTEFILSSPYIIRVSSFSKNFAMSGWRIGYMVLPSHLFEKAYTIQDSIFICPSLIGQYAALGALKNHHLYTFFSNYIKENKNIICSSLEPLKKNGLISFHEPSAAFYLFVKTQHENTFQLCFDIAKKAGVTLVPGSAFGPGFSSYVRICFAREKNILLEGISRFISYWNIENV